MPYKMEYSEHKPRNVQSSIDLDLMLNEVAVNFINFEAHKLASEIIHIQILIFQQLIWLLIF